MLLLFHHSHQTESSIGDRFYLGQFLENLSEIDSSWMIIGRGFILRHQLIVTIMRGNDIS